MNSILSFAVVVCRFRTKSFLQQSAFRRLVGMEFLGKTPVIALHIGRQDRRGVGLEDQLLQHLVQTRMFADNFCRVAGQARATGHRLFQAASLLFLGKVRLQALTQIGQSLRESIEGDAWLPRGGQLIDLTRKVQE